MLKLLKRYSFQLFMIFAFVFLLLCMYKISTKPVYASTSNGEWVCYGTYTTTGYCPCKKCCGHWSGGPTASGVMPKSGHTIATGKEFSFGTEIMIDGVVYTTEDRGVGNGHIDIFYSDHKTALNHGVQKKTIYVRRK